MTNNTPRTQQFGQAMFDMSDLELTLFETINRHPNQLSESFCFGEGAPYVAKLLGSHNYAMAIKYIHSAISVASGSFANDWRTVELTANPTPITERVNRSKASTHVLMTITKDGEQVTI